MKFFIKILIIFLLQILSTFATQEIDKINQVINKFPIDTLKSLVLNNNHKLIYLYNESNDEKTIKLFKGDILVREIHKPSPSEIGNFSIRRIVKIKNGFQISVDYGTRYYFSKIFDFKLVNGNFFLSKITIWSFDKFNPENTGRKKSVQVKIPIIDFTFEKYSVD